MFKKSLICIFVVFIALAFVFFAGCSDDSPTTSAGDGENGGTILNFDLSLYTALVEEIAPPVYTSPVGKTAVLDSVWFAGDYPLLGKVFSDEEPMSLYWNLERLDAIISEINTALAQDSVFDEDSSGADTNSNEFGWYEIIELSMPTTIPTECAEVFGFTSLDLDYVIKMHSAEDSNFASHAGFKVDSSEEQFLTYFKNENPAEYGGGTETFVYYAYRNLNTDSINIMGVFYKLYPDSTTSARWVYDIKSVEDSLFDYRMSWFSDELETSLLGCIIGGGNKDQSFALKYNQYMPADAESSDPEQNTSGAFNSDYSEATDFATEYADFLHPSRYFTFDYIPTGYLPSPWASE